LRGFEEDEEDKTRFFPQIKKIKKIGERRTDFSS
jgi:hypothetical protein